MKLFQHAILTIHSITLYRVRALALPIPTAAAAATIVLPLITGASLRGVQSVNRRAKNASSSPTLVMFVLLIIYETVVATLALSHMVPASELTCGLDRQWTHLFSSKDAEKIRRIQDRHHCCGLRTAIDRAWPFPDKHHLAASCTQMFDRPQSCLAGWMQDMQMTAGLMLLVVVVVFLTKVGCLVPWWLSVCLVSFTDFTIVAGIACRLPSPKPLVSCMDRLYFPLP